MSVPAQAMPTSRTPYGGLMPEPLTPEEASAAELALAQEAAAEAYRAQLERLNQLAGKLEDKARSCIRMRESKERQWKEDIRQYNGQYDPATEKTLKDKKGASRVFLKVTRSKVNTAEARLADMLFPTDDRNWAILPTPDPELDKLVGNTQPLTQPRATVDPATGQAVAAQVAVHDAAGNQLTVSDRAAEMLKEVKRRAEGMQTAIEDQLNESNYALHARDCIHDAAVVGTGVLKGPMVVNRTRKAFLPDGAGGWKYEVIEDKKPAVQRIDFWDFYPDMSTTLFEECEYAFDVQRLTKAQMRQLRKTPFYLAEQIDDVLGKEPGATVLTPNVAEELREAGESVMDRSRYEVWEYHGPVKVEDLIACGCEEELTALGDAIGDEVPGCVVFCGGVVIKAYVEPLDAGELPYSVFAFERDETSIFGFGVAYLMRDSQRVANAAWRMLLDNAGLSTGPQIALDKSAIEPADGSWDLTPRKIWYKTDKNKNIRDCFATFNIDSHQAELAAILQDALRLADEETNLPLIAQGTQSPGATKTAQGMSMLMNAANVVLRRAVRAFDDGVTRPLITRFYHYNMQYSERADIKGDFAIDARGSSVLLAKEIQAQNLMQLAFNFASHPAFGPWTKIAPLHRKVVQSHHVSQEDVVKSDREFEQEQAQKSKDAPPPSEAAEQHQARMQELAYERETKLMLAGAERENLIYKLGAERVFSADQMEAELAKLNLKINADASAQMREAQIKSVFGSGL